MTDKTKRLDRVILGSCSFFACRCCHTKVGWTHQEWCEDRLLSEPDCPHCLYYSAKHSECRHPALKKRREESPYEEDQYPL